MGISFDDNGIYVGWSSIFDYSTIRTVQASEYLPAPRKMLYDKVNTGYSLNEYIKLKDTLEKNIKLWSRELDSDDIDEYRKAELTENINKAEEQLRKSGLDINKELVQIGEYDNTIISKTNRIKEINSIIRKVKAEEKLNLLNEQRKLTDEIEEIRVARINTLVKVLKAINKISNKVGELYRANLYYTVDNKLLLVLRDHEFTDIPKQLLESANKNFISSHILNTVQNLYNMIKAYSPIEMEDFRKASDLSEKGEQASRMTMLNPTTKMVMLYSNMTGKNVIGIAANAIKASFMWNYYLNEIVRNNPTLQELDYALFEFKLTRVVGRADNNILEKTINTLPEVNFYGLDPALERRMGNKLKGPIPTDLMSSLVLSAATDNAKELILAKVNAGNKFAKMYLFLIALGVDVRDIVKFMTSNVTSFIDQITEEDIFTEEKISVYDAIEMAKGNFSAYSTKYGKQTIEELKELYRSYKLNDEVSKLDNIKDAEEFKNILEGADEFSRFGQLLGLNLGLKVTEIDLRKMLGLILNIVSSRLKEVSNLPLNIREELSTPLDINLWLSNAAYRDRMKFLYNHIKKCINIFDIFDKINLFDAIREILDAVVAIDNNLTIKTKAYIKLLDKAVLDKAYMKDDDRTRLLRTIDNAIITKFVLGLNDIKIPISKHATYITSDGDIILAAEDGEFGLKSKSDIASFKYIFENIIVPNLRKGVVQDYVEGQIVESLDAEISSNPFILALLKASYKDVPLYKVNLNMLTIENSTESLRKFNIYTQALQKLSNKYINGISISDWFILYNIIVNKNLYGADRLTTLFDKFTTTGLSSLLDRYFKWLGDLDYFGEVQLDTDNPSEFDTSFYKDLRKKGYLLEISYKDSLIEAAKIVSSPIGQTSPYIKVNTEYGLVLMERDQGGYKEIKGVILQRKGEPANHYLDRLNTYNSYYVLGESFSENLSRQIREIVNLSERALDYINDFVLNGILTINKICE